jgi:hypothetical protein
MPYDMQSGAGAPAAAGLEAGGGEAGGEGAAGQSEPIHIAADMLPQGIAEGDMLKCTGMDENGCSFELVKGEGQTGEDGTSWEDDFRNEMSPRQPQQEAS